MISGSALKKIYTGIILHCSKMLHIKHAREKERKTGGKDYCINMVCSVIIPKGTYKDNSIRHVQDLLLVCTLV